MAKRAPWNWCCGGVGTMSLRPAMDSSEMVSRPAILIEAGWQSGPTPPCGPRSGHLPLVNENISPSVEGLLST
jgi:hypothetical protein